MRLLHSSAWTFLYPMPSLSTAHLGEHSLATPLTIHTMTECFPIGALHKIWTT